MNRLLGGIAESGAILNLQPLWRAAGCQSTRGARMLVADRATRKGKIVEEKERVQAAYAFVLPSNGYEEARNDIWVGLHGTLYNLPELAQESGVSQYGEHSARQSELVRQSYMRWGASCFARFRGSFACAILDLRNNKLLLARDHIGSKSLFFSTRGGFYFASTIKALLDINGLPARPNVPILQNWLLDIPCDDPTQTFFDGVVRLASATCVQVNLSTPMSHSITEFWPLHDLSEQDLAREEAEKRLRWLLTESLELSTRDVHSAGVTLSGGLDSSAILAALRNCKGNGYPIHSFTFVSDMSKSRAEESRARTVAELCGSENHLVRYDCLRIPAEIDDLLMSLEEPFSSPVLFAHRELYRVAHAAGVRTVLNGQGADSLFAGSDSHLVAFAASLFRRGKVIRSCSMLANAASGYRLAQLSKSVVGYGLPHSIKAVLRPRIMPDWLRDDWFRERKTKANGSARHATNIRAQLMQELKALSLPHILRFEERAAEACFVCNRSPFLAPELVEFALSLSEELLIGRDGHTKSILRSACRDILPKTILKSRERLGFPVPAHEWLRSLMEWATEELAYSRNLPFINPSKVHALLESFQRSDDDSWQKAIKIWRLILLTRWAKVFSLEF